VSEKFEFIDQMRLDITEYAYPNVASLIVSG
jgi:hypothetical protein